METHELANIIPNMSDDEYKALKLDIQTNGLFNPIMLYEYKILDGRNRYKACKELNIEPKYENYQGDSPVSYVLSLNIKRRHLNSSQLACIALDVLPNLEKEAKERQLSNLKQGDKTLVPQKIAEREKGEAKQIAAKLVGANKEYIRQVEKLKEESPDLYEEVKQGKKTIPEVKRELIKKEHKNLPIPILPEGKYDVIYADPPWKYDFTETENREIENKYPTMKLEEIKNMPITNLLNENCVIFLWATAPKLREALEVIKAWGFEYKTHMIWDKEIIGMGYWFRGQHELLLVATKGQVSVPDPNIRASSVYKEKRTSHSKKPNYFYSLIEKYFPNGKYLELFARQKYNDKWTVFGNQL